MSVESDSEKPSPSNSPSGRRWPLGKFAVLYGLVIATAAACIFGSPPAKVSQPGVDMRLPGQVLGFQGKDQPISESEKVLLPSDTEIVKKLYADSAGDNVNFQIVLSGVDRRSIHRPEICLTGQGWKVRSGQVVPIKLRSGSSLPVMVLDITRPLGTDKESGELEALYLYWFVSSDAQTPYHAERIARTSIDLLLHNKAHRWAYVIAMAPILKGLKPDGKDRGETLQMLEDFVRETVPSFQHNEMSSLASALKTTAINTAVAPAP